jgi:hypothetical protein
LEYGRSGKELEEPSKKQSSFTNFEMLYRLHAVLSQFLQMSGSRIVSFMTIEEIKAESQISRNGIWGMELLEAKVLLFDIVRYSI